MSRSARWGPLAAVVALLVAAMLSAAYANPVIDSLGPSQQDVQDGPQAPPPPPDLTGGPTGAPQGGSLVPAWVGWAVLALGVLLVLGVLFVLLRILRRYRISRRESELVETTEPVTPTETARKVREALDEGLAELDDADSDPRRAVIACWVRLEEAAAAAGIVRAVGDTSTELVQRLLAGSQVSLEVLEPFAAVYREARFATHSVDIGMRDQARAALTQLRDELALGVS
jgi:Domain of unknown function (DUF4129)